MKRISDKRSLIIIVLVAVSFIRPTKGFFGLIPEFLEMGDCHNATLVDGFDPVKYQGLWFQIESVPNEYQLATKCVSTNYTWADDGFIAVEKGVSDDDQKVRKVSEILEELELRDPPHPAHLTVFADNVPESPYQIISTDYITHSCVYSCLATFGFRAEFFWIFSRQPTLAPEEVTKCYEALTNMGVDPSKLEPTHQDQVCPYSKKLDQIVNANQQVMTGVGLSPSTASFPPLPALFHATKNQPPQKSQQDILNVNVVGVLEVEPEPEDEQDPASTTFSSALKTNNNVIPLVILEVILLPILLR